MLAQVTAALELSREVERFGAYAGVASIFGLAILSLLYFGQARELKRLREWAGRAPERAAELQRQAAAYEEQVAAAQAAGTGGAAAGPVRQAGTPLPPRVGPAVPVGAVAGGSVAAASAAAGSVAAGAGPAQDTQLVAGNGAPRIQGPVREDGTGPLPAVALPGAGGAPNGAPAAAPGGASGTPADPGSSPALPGTAPSTSPATSGAAPSPSPAVPDRAPAVPAGEPAGGPGRPIAVPGAPGAEPAASPAHAPDGVPAPAAVPAVAAAAAASPSAYVPGAGAPATAAAGRAPAPAGAPSAGGPGGGGRPGGTGAVNGAPPPGRAPLDLPAERPVGPVRASAAGAALPPRTAAGAVRARPAGTGPESDGGGRRLLPWIGGGVVALAVAAVLAVTLLGGGDSDTTAPAPAPQGNRLEDPAAAPAEPATPPLDRSQFSIRVLNGTTIAGVARTVNDRLERRDYTAAAQPTNATVNTVPTTTVSYTEGNRRAANDVARILGVAQENVVQADEATRVQGGGADVIVTVGADKADG